MVESGLSYSIIDGNLTTDRQGVHAVMIHYIEKAAIEAGEILLSEASRGIEISHKEHHELVTNADLLSEKFLKERLSELLPEAGFLGEESWTGGMPLAPFWVVDPLDGTNNYAHGYPVFCVSIALWTEDGVHEGCIYDPSREELFSAVKDRGAQLNHQPIYSTEQADIEKCILATGFPYHRQIGDLGVDLSILEYFLRRVQGIRRGGSAALDLAYVASGRLDGFWEEHLKPWDMAAGALIVREAGGSVSAFTGGKWDINSEGIIASGKPIHREMLRGINKGKG